MGILAVRQCDVLRHCPDQFFANCLHRCARHEIADDHRKLIPAQAGDGVRLAHAGQPAVRHRFQHDVPGIVPMLVIDRLETIKIEKKQRHLPLVAPGSGNRLCQPVEEHRPRRQAGQRIAHRLRSHDFVGAFQPDVGGGHSLTADQGQAEGQRRQPEDEQARDRNILQAAKTDGHRLLDIGFGKTDEHDQRQLIDLAKNINSLDAIHRTDGDEAANFVTKNHRPVVIVCRTRPLLECRLRQTRQQPATIRKDQRKHPVFTSLQLPVVIREGFRTHGRHNHAVELPILAFDPD